LWRIAVQFPRHWFICLASFCLRMFNFNFILKFLKVLTSWVKLRDYSFAKFWRIFNFAHAYYLKKCFIQLPEYISPNINFIFFIFIKIDKTFCITYFFLFIRLFANSRFLCWLRWWRLLNVHVFIFIFLFRRTLHWYLLRWLISFL